MKQKRQKVQETEEWEGSEDTSKAKDTQTVEIDKVVCMKRAVYLYYAILKKSFKADVPKFVVMYLIDKTTNEMNVRLHQAAEKVQNKIDLVSD